MFLGSDHIVMNLMRGCPRSHLNGEQRELGQRSRTQDPVA